MRVHREPADLGDRCARGIARLVHLGADAWFGPRMTHRTLILEALAGVPATVIAFVSHLRSLRTLCLDQRVSRAVEQAKHEQAHCFVFAALVRPTAVEQALLRVGQTVLAVGFVALVLANERIAHRLAAYFEEEALESYDGYLDALESGRVESATIPAWASLRWHLPAGADLRMLVPIIEHEEEEHRDEHHAAADAIVRRTRTRGHVASSKRRVFG